MATIEPADDGNRVMCDLPACKAHRLERGQQNGRWLFNVKLDAGRVVVTTRCAECGGTHSVTFPIPPKAH